MSKPVTHPTAEIVIRARALLAETQAPPVALLQRHLKIGYAQALALVNQLERESIMHTIHPIARSPRAQGALMGLAVGDALGTTLEFKQRGTFESITDMVGGGPFNLKPGQWTDDTSMALCLADSLHAHGFDLHDQLKKYLDWHDRGYRSSTGTCFDIGLTTSTALERYRATGNVHAGSADPMSAGNGSIMRLAPVVIYFQDSPEDAIRYSADQSQTTHRAPECLMACQLMAETMLRALQGLPKQDVLAPSNLKLAWTPGLAVIANGSYRHKTIEAIRGSGYVVESLEAALWCFATTNTFAQCVLKAANLGDDADTTAAVAGQIAGAHYSIQGIPPHWQTLVALALSSATLHGPTPTTHHTSI